MAVGPSVELSLPPTSWFRFPPTNWPKVLPAPSPLEGEWTWRAPFAISPALYNNALEWRLPVTFAIFYVATVLVFNSINHQREYKPWPVSRSQFFRVFVLVHNIALAVYSAVTCFAMVRALSVSFPGFTGEHGLPGAIDALCKINGPRGFGDAVTYNSTMYTWGSSNHKIHLGEDNLTPDTTDVGRIWNEGLAFWGWLFYVSKFYEVVDNVVVILKGKRVSTLQMYHHAGALLCMWAGIRYMSPPIWMFVLVNSGIHALMYTYYTATATGRRPSKFVKETITTLQITQFVVGLSFAAAHLFVSYSGPVAIAYTVRSIMSGLPSAFSSLTHRAGSSLHSAAIDAGSLAHDAQTMLQHGMSSKSWSSASVQATGSAASFGSALASSASVTASSLAVTASKSGSSLAAQATSNMATLASKALADDGFWLKKLLYRAVGREALAEALRNSDGLLVGPEFDEGLIPRKIEKIKEEIRYRTEYQTVQCLDTDGQAFAIWLNVLYLVPLTMLFANFFIRTYRGGHKGKQRTASESASIAMRKTNATVERVGKKVEKNIEVAGEEVAQAAKDNKLEERMQAAGHKVEEKVQAAGHNVRGSIDKLMSDLNGTKVEQKYEEFKDGVSNVIEQIRHAADGSDATDDDLTASSHSGGKSPTKKSSQPQSATKSQQHSNTQHSSSSYTQTSSNSHHELHSQSSSVQSIKHEDDDEHDYETDEDHDHSLASSTVHPGESYADAIKVGGGGGQHNGGGGSASGTPSKKKKKKRSQIPTAAAAAAAAKGDGTA